MRTLLKIQEAEMLFLCRVAGLCFCNNARSSVISGNLCIKPLRICTESNQLKLFGLFVNRTTDFFFLRGCSEKTDWEETLRQALQSGRNRSFSSLRMMGFSLGGAGGEKI